MTLNLGNGEWAKKLHCQIHGHVAKEERVFHKPTMPQRKSMTSFASMAEKFGFTQLVWTCEVCGLRKVWKVIGNFVDKPAPQPPGTIGQALDQIEGSIYIKMDKETTDGGDMSVSE